MRPRPASALVSLLGCFPFFLSVTACAAPSGFPPTLRDLMETQPLVLDGRHDIELRDLRISNPGGNCILLRNCKNVLIRNCEFGASAGEGVHLVSCTSVTITGCFMHEVRTGVYAVDSVDIAVERSAFRNVKGPMPRGQMVQFDKVTGARNSITSNTLVNEPGASTPEDGISIYKSRGTSDSPLRVAANRIFGGGPSRSGGGIMLGDSGGAHIIAADNLMVNPGQYGIAVAGGTSIQVLNNTIFGRAQPFTNVGLYVWNQSDAPCADITVRGNRVKWHNAEGKESPCWNGNNCGPIPTWAENDWHAPLDEDILLYARD